MIPSIKHARDVLLVARATAASDPAYAAERAEAAAAELREVAGLKAARIGADPACEAVRRAMARMAPEDG